MAQISFPPSGLDCDGSRTVVFGKSGSGKTVWSMWLLSTRNFHEMPWFIFDTKGEKMVRPLLATGARELDVRKNPLERPGLYVIKPNINEPAAINDFIGKVWDNGYAGLYFDEGFNIPQHRPFKSFDNVMNQGRSKNIPVIACYQRPAWLSQFAMANADYMAVFRLQKPEDYATVAEYLPDKTDSGIPVNYRLPKAYCLWYEDEEGRMTLLSPCPPPEKILATFEHRLGAQKKRGLFS